MAIRLGLVTVLAVLGLGACGDDDGGDAADAGGAGAAAGSGAEDAGGGGGGSGGGACASLCADSGFSGGEAMDFGGGVLECLCDGTGDGIAQADCDAYCVAEGEDGADALLSSENGPNDKCVCDGT